MSHFPTCQRRELNTYLIHSALDHGSHSHWPHRRSWRRARPLAPRLPGSSASSLASCPRRFAEAIHLCSSTGRTLALSQAQGSSARCPRTASWASFPSLSRLRSRSRVWSSSRCTSLSPVHCPCGGGSDFESVCSAASETESPRTNIAKAVRRVFYRIVVFYVRASLYHSARHVDNTSDTDLGHPDHRHVGPVQRS